MFPLPVGQTLRGSFSFGAIYSGTISFDRQFATPCIQETFVAPLSSRDCCMIKATRTTSLEEGFETIHRK